MTIKIRPLTKKQLADVVQCYSAEFPGWGIADGVGLTRSMGPIMQVIGFEGLRSGAYRPCSGIRALPLPSVVMLHQFLDIRHREILPRQHPMMWKPVVVAMEQQFRPAVRNALDLCEVKRLCEDAMGQSSNDLCMLAILHAYLGEKQAALSCCDRIGQVGTPALAPRLDWEQRHREFANQLREAINAGQRVAWTRATG